MDWSVDLLATPGQSTVGRSCGLQRMLLLSAAFKSRHVLWLCARTCSATFPGQTCLFLAFLCRNTCFCSKGKPRACLIWKKITPRFCQRQPVHGLAKYCSKMSLTRVVIKTGDLEDFRIDLNYSRWLRAVSSSRWRCPTSVAARLNAFLVIHTKCFNVAEKVADLLFVLWFTSFAFQFWKRCPIILVHLCLFLHISFEDERNSCQVCRTMLRIESSSP